MKRSIFFFLVHLFIIIKAENFINSTCKTLSENDANINSDFCSTSLQAAPAAHCANLHELGVISIRLVGYNVTDARCYIKQLIHNTKWERYTNQCLSDCFDLFSDAITTMKHAVEYYNAKRFDDVNVQLTSVMDAATTCEDGFKERIGVASPMTKTNDDVFQLSAIALSIVCLVVNLYK